MSAVSDGEKPENAIVQISHGGQVRIQRIEGEVNREHFAKQKRNLPLQKHVQGNLKEKDFEKELFKANMLEYVQLGEEAAKAFMDCYDALFPKKTETKPTVSTPSIRWSIDQSADWSICFLIINHLDHFLTVLP